MVQKCLMQVLVSFSTHALKYIELDRVNTRNKTPQTGFCVTHEVLGYEGSNVSYRQPNVMKKYRHGVDHSMNK